MKYLITGLGNIGEEYDDTRHNIGFMVLDRLAEKQGVEFQIDRFSLTAHFKYKGRQIYLVKPTTFMNLSGKAVRYWSQQLKVPLENNLIVTDDIALPFGKRRMRAKGSSAGHNGLKDIEAQLGTQNYPRLRIGIDNRFSKGRQSNYVLTPFKPEEAKELPFIIEHACDAILNFCTIGIARTMNQCNS